MNWKLLMGVFVACFAATLIVSLVVKYKTYDTTGKTQTGVSKPGFTSTDAPKDSSKK